MLHALAAGETDAARLAALADPALRATAEQLQDALSAAATLTSPHRQILGLFLARLELIESHMQVLEKHWASIAGAPGRREAARRGSRLRDGLSSPGYRRNRTKGRHVPLRRTTLFLGGRVSRSGRVSRGIQE